MFAINSIVDVSVVRIISPVAPFGTSEEAFSYSLWTYEATLVYVFIWYCEHCSFLVSASQQS